MGPGERAVADDPAKTATVTRPAATINANTLRLARLLISHRYYDHPAPPSHNPLGDSLLHRATNSGARGVDHHANIRSMEFGFTVTQHEPTRPWIVVGREPRTVTLADDVNFFDWAREHWPAPRWTVQLDPWQLTHN